MLNLTNNSRVRLHPVNTAEAVIMPFFDPGLSPEKEWVLESGSGTRELRLGASYSTHISWESATPGVPAFIWRWAGRLDVGEYDGFFLQASIASSARIRFRVRLDGVWQTIAEGPGFDAHEDYMGSFAGRILEEMEITVTPSLATGGGFTTYYIGVHHSARLRDWLAYEHPQVYSADWPEFIKPESEWTLSPELALCFGADEVAALREKISKPPYRNMADILRIEARNALSLEPEKEIRQYIGCGESPYGYSARSRDRRPTLWRPMEICAFFGLLDGDPQLVRMAARCAIAMAHTRHWAEGFVEHDFPGSAVNWRSFFQNIAVMALTATVDWIGGALTAHAKEVINHSLFFKGLAPIKYDFARYEYIYQCNQALGFSAGRISGLLALRQAWPRMDWELPQAEKDLQETARRIISPDGSQGEGPSYYGGLMFYMLSSYLLLARGRKVTPQSLVPPGLFHGADYYGVFLSSAEKGEALPISDGMRRRVPSDWPAMMAAITEDPRWKGLLTVLLDGMTDKISHDVINQVWTCNSIRTLIYGPADLSDRAEIIPVFQIQNGSGHATSRRATPHGDVRLHLCGASAAEGHSHHDKGAILLEVFGESLLIDRGTPIYGDPTTGTLKQARMHNLLTPLDAQGFCCPQINPCPKPVCPTGEGDAQRLHLAVDCTVAWGDVVRRMTRELDSPDPLHFTIIDEVELPEERALVFHLHSYYPVEVQGKWAVFQAKNSRLQVSWDWAGEIMTAGVDLHDGNHQPVYHLAVKAPVAIRHRLVTHFEIIPTSC